MLLTVIKCTSRKLLSRNSKNLRSNLFIHYLLGEQQLSINFGKKNYNITSTSRPITKRESFNHLRPLCLGSIRNYCVVRKFSIDEDPLKTYLARMLEEYKSLCHKMENLEGLTEEQCSEMYERHAELAPLAQKVKTLKQLHNDMNEIAKMVAGLCPDDRQMREAARKELHSFKEDTDELKDQILQTLVPSDRIDDSDIIFEASAGVGGKEAMLFCGEMFDMYCNYAKWRGWNVQVIDYNRMELGGLRNGSCTISGSEAYRYLKYESGIHRVQRVPVTEKSGRIHTSTMAIAILPQPTEIDIVINPFDLKIDTFRAQGKGGQHINTTDSAVRITHTKTNTVVECQTDRSQIKNREMAMKILRTRLYQKEIDRLEQQRRKQRKLQVGTAGRSEKIRTYNFHKDRITDHRIGESVYNIKDFLSGGEALNNIIELLQDEARFEYIQELLESYTSNSP